MLRSIIKAIRKVFRIIQPEYKVETAEELPELIQGKTVYILGAHADPWALAFSCPCGCATIIQLNLLQEARPRWRFSITWGGNITIRPSIWRKQGCRSHFFIQKGRIIWC